MQHGLTERIGPWINAAIDNHAQGEKVGWETGLLPGPNGEALFTVFLWFPGAVLGTSLNGSFQIADPMGLTEDELDKIMVEFLRQLREARSQQIEKRSGQSTNGHSPRSGLILP